MESPCPHPRIKGRQGPGRTHRKRLIWQMRRRGRRPCKGKPMCVMLGFPVAGLGKRGLWRWWVHSMSFQTGGLRDIVSFSASRRILSSSRHDEPCPFTRWPELAVDLMLVLSACVCRPWRLWALGDIQYLRLRGLALVAACACRLCLLSSDALFKVPCLPRGDKSWPSPPSAYYLPYLIM